MRHIPIIFMYARLGMGVLILLFSLIKLPYYTPIAISLLVTGLLTDILDGIIARKLQISTTHLRRLDSTIDQFFFVCVAVATYVQCPVFFTTRLLEISLLFGSELLIYVVCFLKFRKEVATHSIGAKLWTLLLVATLIDCMLDCHSSIVFGMCIWIGLLTRLEILAIILTLKTWTNDVPSLYHATQLRKGKPIRRHTLLNG